MTANETDTIGTIKEKAWQVLWDRASEEEQHHVLATQFTDYGLVRRAVCALPDGESVLDWAGATCECCAVPRGRFSFGVRDLSTTHALTTTPPVRLLSTQGASNGCQEDQERKSQV